MMAKRGSVISLERSAFARRDRARRCWSLSRGAWPREIMTYGFDRTWQEGARVLPDRSERRHAQALSLPGTPRHPLFLSEGRHTGLHAGNLRVSDRAARPENVQGGGSGRQHPGREEQGEVREEARD